MLSLCLACAAQSVSAVALDSKGAQHQHHSKAGHERHARSGADIRATEGTERNLFDHHLERASHNMRDSRNDKLVMAADKSLQEVAAAAGKASAVALEMHGIVSSEEASALAKVAAEAAKTMSALLEEISDVRAVSHLLSDIKSTCIPSSRKQIVVYNRIPKAGSSSMLSMIQKLAKRNRFTYSHGYSQ